MSTPRKPTPSAPAEDTKRAPSSLWKNRDFLLFWGGESVSLMGTQISELAIPFTAILVLSVSADKLGLLRFAQFVPFLFFSLPFGFFVDRQRKRPLMLAANIGRAVLIGLVPALYALHILHLPVLYVVAFLVGTLTVMFDLCWMSYVPLLVSDRNHLADANSKIGSSVAAADLAGPGLAGALVQALSAPLTLVANAGSYVVSIVTLLLIRPIEPKPELPPREGGLAKQILGELNEGLRWVITNPYIRTPSLIAGGYNFFYFFTETLLPLYMVRTLHFSAGQYGLVLSVSATGALLGAMMAGQLIRRVHFGRTYTVAILISYSSPFLIPLLHSGHVLILLLVMASLWIRQLGAGLANVMGITLRQAVTPPRLMGRMTAAVRMLLYGVGALGAPVGGVIGTAVGLRSGLWVAAAGSCLVATTVLVSSIPRLKAVPAPEPALSTASE